ncbi:MAG TPA: hypothetical protein VFA26_12205 [Gemmataceae bacterium]|nr:hypothetical protein [Gemmataceae bacterium]
MPPGAAGRMMRPEGLQEWPAVGAKPNGAARWRRLERAAAEGKVLRKGMGRRNSPFRCWLAEAEERWRRPGFPCGGLAGGSFEGPARRSAWSWSESMS